MSDFQQRLENLPAEILALPRFLPTRKDNPKAPKGKDWQKPENQVSYSELKDIGGFVAATETEESLIFFDFDHVLDDNGNFVSADAEMWFNDLHGEKFYCERSISGQGLHIFALPTRGKFSKITGKIYLTEDKKSFIEVFYRTTKFCLVTGALFCCEPNAHIAKGEIADRVTQKILNALARQTHTNPRKPVDALTDAHTIPDKEEAKKQPLKAKTQNEDTPEYDLFRAQLMLDAINPEMLSDEKWLAVMSACKNIGIDYHVVDTFNRRDSKRYNEKENLERWNSKLDSGFDIETLHGITKQFGYSEKDARRQWHDLHPEISTNTQTNDGNIVRTRNRVKDCPVNLRVPQDFIFSSKGVTFVKPATEKKPAAYIPAIKTPVVVTKRLRADGIKRYEVAIRICNVWEEHEVDAQVLTNARRIHELDDYGCLVADAGLATRFFISFLADNERDLNELKIYSKPGWNGEKFIYPTPKESSLYRVERSNIDYSAMFATKGTIGEWIKKFVDISNRSAIHRIYIGAALAAPLLYVLGLPNFWLHINGRRNLCKTPLMKFALSIFGNPEKIMRTFDASPKHLVTMAVGLNDLPQGIDEGETLNEKAMSAFQTTIYNFVAGVDGQRNQRNGDVRVTEDFRGVRISTSEQPLLRKSNKGGAYKRFIDLHLSEALFNVTEGRELHLFVTRCHGHFGRLWTEYVVTHAKEILADFEAISKSLAEEYGDEYETAHLLNLAACAVAFWHFRLLLQLDTKFEKSLARADASIVLKHLPTQEEIDDTKRWIELLAGYVASHPKHFWRKVILADGTIPTETFYAPTLYGRVFEDDSVAIIGTVLKQICEELNIPNEKFINELFEGGYFLNATGKHKAKVIRIGGNLVRAFVFKPGVLWRGESKQSEDEFVTSSE